MSDVPATLILQPDELLFPGVRLNQAYCQTVTISNPSRATVEATLRAGSSDRWNVSPTELVLKPQQSIDVDVRLRVLKFAQKQKAIQQGQRDIFHIKAAYFEQKFYATFFLTPDAAEQQPNEAAQRQRRSERSHSAGPRSPCYSPRDLPSAGQSVSPRQHPPSPPSPLEHSRQHSTDAHSLDEHGKDADTHAQHLQGPTEHHSSMSTPDLSPRGDLEAEDPPTPRMYKAIIPTAASGSNQKPDTALHHSPKLKPDMTQVVLHQGHYDHGRQHAIPQRHAEPKGQQQAFEDLRQTVRDKDQEISSLRSELAAAKHRISLDERASKVTSSIDTAGMSLHTQSQVERLEAANAQLEGSNAELRDRLHELSAQAEAAQAQVEALQGLQSSLQDAAGPSLDALIDAAVGKERAVQDARNRKVLELLNNKDEVIQRFEDRCTEANAEIQQLQAALQDANKRLETADNRLSSTMESRNKLRKQLEAKHSDTTFMQASLAADNEVLKDKLQEAASRAAERVAAPASPEQGKLATRLRAQLEVHKEALQAAREETTALASSLEKANSLIESKDADIQGLKERCNSKDEEVAALAQHVEQLQSTVEASKQADAMAHQHSPRDWAVDVSLDQGMGLGPAHMLPSSPTALRQRVHTLEVANQKLEEALMASHRHAAHVSATAPSASTQGGSAAYEATINSMRSLLSEREHQLSRLEADLAIARAYSGSGQLEGESAQAESALKIELDVLRRRLSEKEAQILSGEERLSCLEAVHRVAQETALRSESQLEATRRSLIELDEDKQAGKEEAESARALALRLNARVSELTLAAECARTDGESARAELERVRSSHDSEIQAFEKRQKQLVSALRAVGAQPQPLCLADSSETRGPGPDQPPSGNGLGGYQGPFPMEQPSDALIAVRDRNQTQAVQEAELAVAVMQAKMLEAVTSQRQAAKQLHEAQQAFDGERAHLEQQVRRSKEEGSVRIQTLEDTVRKLGNRSDLHQELARLGGEASFLRRTEARLKSNLGFAEDRTNELQREVTILRQQVASFEASEHEAQVLEDVQRSVASESSAGGNIAAKMGEFSRELSNEGSQPHIVARLMERAEASEVQLAQAQNEMKALKQAAAARAAVEGAGTSAAMSAAQAVEERAGDLQRQLLMAQCELKAAREDAHIHELDKSQLKAQLSEAAREVATAQSRVADSERLAYDSEQVVLHRDPQGSSEHFKEAAHLARQKADAERRAGISQAAQQQTEQSLRMAQLELARLKASLDAKTKANKRAEQAALQKADNAEHELAAARRECERAAGDAEDRKVQLSVLVETVETLQAGTPGEKDQRIVSLTAQLTTARMKEAVSERRASQLQCELEEHAMHLHKAQSQLDKAEHKLSEKDTEAAISKAASEAGSREISSLRGELKAHADTTAQTAREVDDARNAAAKAEAEALGLRAALDAARTRHFEQLTRERAEAAASKRESSATALLPSLSPPPESTSAGPLALISQPSSQSLAAGIDDLVAALKPRKAQQGGRENEDMAASVSGDDDLPHRVVRRMKAMLLEAQASSAKADTDLRIAAAEAAALASKVRPLEIALDKRINEREAAVAELETSAAINAARQAQASTHAEQHNGLQARRLAALSDQLEKSNSQVTKLSISLKQAHAQESSHKWQRDSLQRKLAVCEGEVQALEAKLSAAHMEAAGSADASRSQSVEAAIQQRDCDIKAYFDTQVLKHVLSPDHQKRSLALTREICGLKVAHHQLIAAHAAAKKLAGAASLQSVTLRQQLQTLQEQQAATQQAKTPTTSNDDQANGDAAAQLASKTHEIYRLQQELLQQRQKLANQEILAQELHAAVQATKNKAQQAQHDGHRELQQTREQLINDFASERDSLLREIQLTRQQQQEAIAQAQKEAADSEQAFAQQLLEVQQQSKAALEGCPSAEQYNEVVDAANSAQLRTQEMEAACSALQAENQQLQAVLRSLEVKVSELQADVETRGSALESLEETLSKIERSADSGRDRSPLKGTRRVSAGKGNAAGARPGTASSLGRSNMSHSDGALAALSRQLVQAKMAEADAQRKHRVSARAELTLRQRLSQREDRISELKDALAAAKGQHPASRSERHPAQLLSPRQNSLTADDYSHSARPELFSRSDTMLPHGRSGHWRAHEQGQHPPAISLRTADDEAVPAAHVEEPQLSGMRLHGGDETNNNAQQRGPDAHRANAKLPYFQARSHAPVEQAAPGSSPVPAFQLGPVQPAGISSAEHSHQAPPRPTGSLPSPRGYASGQRLHEQISDLRIELARRDADAEYLEGQLAEAVAANRSHQRNHADEPPEQDISLMAKRAEELESSLVLLQKECSQAVAAAQAVVGRPATPRGSPRSSEDGAGAVSVDDVVRQLLSKLKDRDASLNRLRAVAKVTAEKVSKERASAAAQPLEASQRAVIRDMSLRVANLTRSNNQLKEERERAQERLRTLRASLGSFKAPPAEEGPRPHQRLAAPTAAPSRSARLAHTPPRRRPDKHASDTPSRTGALAVLAPPRRAASGTLESAGSAPWAAENSTEVGQGSEVRGGQATGRLLECQAVQGLCQLLEHHVAVLEQSQEPVGKLLQSDATQNGPQLQQLLASKDALVSQGARQLLAAAAVAASAELAAMRSSLQVLSSHLDALQSNPAALDNKGVGQPLAEGNDNSRDSFLEAVSSPRQPMLALLPAPPAHTRQKQEQAAQTMPVSLESLSPEASTTQDDGVAEQLQQAADRAQKWKQRCAKLRQELMESQTAAASSEAALSERLAGLEKSSEDLSQQHRKELSRLEAALAGAEAAKNNLSKQQAQHSTAGESDLQAAHAAQAEADARAASLQRQIDTLRAQAAASRSGLQDEANSLKAALSKEKSERARIVLSLRDTITGLKQAGDVEGRLKADLVQTHEDLATSRAMQEQLEAKLTQKRSEVKALNVKLDTAQRKLSQSTADAELANRQTTLTMFQAQQQIAGLEADLKDSSLQLSELHSKAEAADTNLRSARESCEVMDKEVARLEQLNRDVKATCQHLQATVDDLSRERQDGASAKWEALLRSRRHRAAVHQIRGDLQAAESENKSVSEELNRARAKGQQAAAEADRLQKRIDDLQHFSNMERQQLAERHVGMMSELEKRMEEERQALRQEGAAMAASAAAAGEDRARTALSARLNEAQQSAFQDITNVANERRQLSDELESLRSQFKAYQKVKTREISSLDHRVRILLQSQAVAGTMRPQDQPLPSSLPSQNDLPFRSVKKSPPARYGKPVMVANSESGAGSDAGQGSTSDGEDIFPASYQPPLAGIISKGKVQCASLTAAAEVGMALESEAVASAVREADFERMQREAAEASIASLHDALEKLKQKLKTTQRDLRAAKDMASSSAADAAGAQANHEELQQLQEQLLASQEALKAAKAESARRLKSLQSLQQQGGEGPHLVANAAFLAEKTAREAAEGKLTTLRRSATHKDDLLKALKTKVDELEAAVRVAKAADHSSEVQAAESRVRSLQGSLSRKEDTIRELRERMDQACRAASEKGAEEEAERQLAAVKKLKAEVTRKEGMLKATQSELDKARQEAAEAAAANQEAAHREQSASHHSSSGLPAVREKARAALDALRTLSKLALRTSAAMQAAAISLQAASDTASPQDDVNAAAVARMVDMSLQEVADLLGGASSHSPGDADSALVAKQVAQTLLELEGALLSSKHASKQSRSSEEQSHQQALEEMLDGLQHQASKAEAMLAEAVSIASAQSTSDRHIAAHQGKRRKKVAQDPVTRLEKDLLRASHGIEAQLYQDL